MTVILFIFSVVPFYLIGAFPTGYLISRRRQIDLKQQGSGNVGAANIARILGLKAGAVTLLVDALKGFVPLLGASLISDNRPFICLAAVALVAGHCFSIPGKLPGGKGVATSLGVILFLQPLAAAAALAGFAATFAATQIVSIASISAAAIAPIAAFFHQGSDYPAAALAMIAALVLIRHKPNLARLIRGKEPRFSLLGRKA